MQNLHACFQILLVLIFVELAASVMHTSVERTRCIPGLVLAFELRVYICTYAMQKLAVEFKSK